MNDIRKNVWNTESALFRFYEVVKDGEIICRYGEDQEDCARDRARSLKASLFELAIEGWQCRPGKPFGIPVWKDEIVL